ncbi:MAG: hypothetical protein QG657_3410 [Acidobacteriota bacterium]|nr:hypothetical protein [Acidobacteriota bacterium]
MKRISLVLFVFVFLAVNLHGGGGGFSYQVDFTSRFIFRGIDILSNNNPAIQPSITYTFGDSGFSLNAWSSFALSERDRCKYLDEIDLTLTYAFNTPEKYLLEVGFTNYGYWFSKAHRFKDMTTQEFFVKAGLPKVLFSPTLVAYYDINQGDGLYLQLSGVHTVALDKKINLDLSAKLGYNAGWCIPEGAKKGFSALTIGATAPFKAGKITLCPFINYTFVFLDAINLNDEFWFGVSVIF